MKLRAWMAKRKQAVGFSLYPSPLIDAGFGAKARDQLFLPLGHDADAASSNREQRVGERLRRYPKTMTPKRLAAPIF